MYGFAAVKSHFGAARGQTEGWFGRRMALHASLPSRSVLLRLLSGLVILFLAHLPVTVAYPLPPLSIARYDLKGAGALDWVAFAGGKVPSLAPLRCV